MCFETVAASRMCLLQECGPTNMTLEKLKKKKVVFCIQILTKFYQIDKKKKKKKKSIVLSFSSVGPLARCGR